MADVATAPPSLIIRPDILQLRASRLTVKDAQGLTAAAEPLQIDLPGPVTGTHWIVKELSCLGGFTVVPPVLPAGALSGLFLVPDAAPAETLGDAQKGWNPAARGLQLPSKLELAGAISLLDGGKLRTIIGTVPAAGADFSETVPAGAFWELISLTLQFATSATVANRVFRITLDDGTSVFFRISTGQAHAASITAFYTAGEGIPYFTFATDSTGSLPLPTNNRLGPGYRIRSLIAALQVADQITALVYTVREFTTAVQRGIPFSCVWDRKGEGLIVPSGWHLRALFNCLPGQTSPGPGALSYGTLSALYTVENDAT